jgi:hypothetical protein
MSDILTRTREIEVLAGEVLAQPDISGAGMAFHALQPRDPRRRLGDGFEPSRVARCQVTIFMNLWTDRPPV